MIKLFFSLVTIAMIWNFGYSALVAQSFLSEPSESTEPTIEILDATNDQITLDVSSDQLTLDTTSDQMMLDVITSDQFWSELTADESGDAALTWNEEFGLQDIPDPDSNLVDNHEPVQAKTSWESLGQILELIEKGEYNQALAELENFSVLANDDMDPEELFDLQEFHQYLLILGNFRLGNYSKTESQAEIYFEHFINGAHYYWVYYYYAAALFSQEKSLRLVYLVTEDFFLNLPNKERSNLRRYLIEDALANKQFLSAINFLEDEEGELIQGYERWIDEIVENIHEIEDIEQVVERYENEQVYYQLQLRKVQLLIRDGNLKQAEDFYYKLFLTSVDGPTHYDNLSKIYDTISLAYETKPYKIGVILPFSHKRHKRYAREVLDGLELGLDNLKINGKSIQLVFKDSAEKDSDPEFQKKTPRAQLLEKQKLVKSQVRDLVENHGVIAILGPLARRTSIAAGEMANEYKIPVISYSLTENIGMDLPSLFRFQRSQLEEARVMANYALDYLNASRFVLFYRSSPKSFEVMQTFADVVKAKGGQIVGIARIGKNQVDFNDTFMSFTGGFRLKSEEEEEELKLTRQRPKPEIDFDAIFLPVDPRTLKVVTDFAKLFDAGKVWILSGSQINVRENQLLGNANRVRFVDTYPISHTKTYLQPFFEAHWKHFNFRANYYAPTSYTIHGYESLEILGKLLSLNQNQSREALRDAIKNLSLLEVLTGSVSSDENGELGKQLKILKIKKNETVAVF